MLFIASNTVRNKEVLFHNRVVLCASTYAGNNYSNNDVSPSRAMGVIVILLSNSQNTLVLNLGHLPRSRKVDSTDNIHSISEMGRTNEYTIFTDVIKSMTCCKHSRLGNTV